MVKRSYWDSYIGKPQEVWYQNPLVRPRNELQSDLENIKKKKKDRIMKVRLFKQALCEEVMS